MGRYRTRIFKFEISCTVQEIPCGTTGIPVVPQANSGGSERGWRQRAKVEAASEVANGNNGNNKNKVCIASFLPILDYCD